MGPFGLAQIGRWQLAQDSCHFYWYQFFWFLAMLLVLAQSFLAGKIWSQLLLWALALAELPPPPYCFPLLAFHWGSCSFAMYLCSCALSFAWFYCLLLANLRKSRQHQ